jgi:hypothetical protein
MKTITELRNYVNTNIKLLGYEHDQIFEIINLFEKGLQGEVETLIKEGNENRLILNALRVQTLNQILK